MSKKGVQLRKQIPCFALGLLGLQLASGFTSLGESFLPKAQAFTTPVTGTVDNEVVTAGGTQVIQSGGIANYTIVNGNQDIRGGTANDSIVNDGGWQEIYNGIANRTIINEGGTQYVHDTADQTQINGGYQHMYGVATNTVLNSGYMYVGSSGTSFDTSIFGGTQGVGGKSHDTRIDGGNQDIYASGIAYNTRIKNGNQTLLSSGAEANNSTAEIGGSINIVSNGTALTGTTTLNGGAIRILPFDSEFEMYYGRTEQFITANVENLAGNGSIYLNTDLGNRIGDLLDISETTIGDYQVFSNNQGAASVDPNVPLTIIKTDDGGGNFTMGHQLEVGGYLYDVRRNAGETKNWELYSTGKYTSTGNASINAFMGGYLLNYAETTTLLQRMGDLRQGEEQQGVWARVFGGKFDSNGSDFLSGFDMNYSGVQVGIDRKLSLQNGKGDWYIGGMFGYAKGNLDYTTGHGSVDSKNLGVYGTYVAPTGFYTDLFLKYGWMDHDFKVLDSAGDRVTASNIKTNGATISLEVGQKIRFSKEKQGWYVEPQAQLSAGHQSGDSFTASNGLRVDVDSYTSVLGRVGMNVGYEIKGGKNPINVYGKVSLIHEFNGDVNFKMNGIQNQESFGNSWWTYGMGITTQIKEKHNLYLDIERSSGGQFRQKWSLNGGYRFNW